MSDPTNILGKIGQKLGEEVKAITDDIADVRASIGNIDIKNLTGPVSIAGDLKVSMGVSVGGNVSVAGSISALGALSALRAVTSADVEVGTDLLVKGDAVIDGNLTTKGTVTKVNTIDVEVKDAILELNKSDSGVATDFDSGLEINTGRDASTTETSPEVPFGAHSGDVTLVPGTSSTSGSGDGDVTFDLTLSSTAFDLECTGIGGLSTPNGSGFTPNISNGYSGQGFVKASDTDGNGNPYFISDDGVFYLVFRPNFIFENDSPANGDTGYNAWVLTRNTADSSPIKETNSPYQRVIVYSMYINSTNDSYYDLFDTSGAGNYQNLVSSTENGDMVYKKFSEYTHAPNSIVFLPAGNGEVESPYPSTLSFQQASSNDSNGNLYYDDPNGSHGYELKFAEDYWASDDSSMRFIGYRIWDTSVSDWVSIKDGGLSTPSGYLYSWVSYQDESYNPNPGTLADPWAIENTTQDIYDNTVLTSADLIIGNESGTSAVGGGSSVVYPYVNAGNMLEVGSTATNGSENLWDNAITPYGFYSISSAYGVSDGSNHRGDLQAFLNEYNANAVNDNEITLTEMNAAFSAQSYDKFALLTDFGSQSELSTGVNETDLAGVDTFYWVLGLESADYVLQIFMVSGGTPTLTDVARFSNSADTVTYMLDYSGADSSATVLTASATSYNVTEPTAYQAAVNETTYTDKLHAKMLWDNRGDQQLFKFMLGDNMADIKADDIEADEVGANSVAIATSNNGDSNLVIGSVSLGTFAHFSNALTAAKS